jgi:hypothetical protein
MNIEEDHVVMVGMDRFPRVSYTFMTLTQAVNWLADDDDDEDEGTVASSFLLRWYSFGLSDLTPLLLLSAFFL